MSIFLLTRFYQGNSKNPSSSLKTDICECSINCIIQNTVLKTEPVSVFWSMEQINFLMQSGWKVVLQLLRVKFTLVCRVCTRTSFKFSWCLRPCMGTLHWQKFIELIFSVYYISTILNRLKLSLVISPCNSIIFTLLPILWLVLN